MKSPPIEIVDLDPHSIVVVWVEDLGSDDRIEAGRRVTDHLRKRGMNNLVVVLRDGAAIGELNEKLMARHGWVRAGQKMEL